MTITTCTVLCLSKWCTTSNIHERELVHGVKISEERDNEEMSAGEMARMFRQFKDELLPTPLRTFLGGGWEIVTVRVVRRYHSEERGPLGQGTGKRVELLLEVENAVKDSDMPVDPF